MNNNCLQRGSLVISSRRELLITVDYSLTMKDFIDRMNFSCAYAYLVEEFEQIVLKESGIVYLNLDLLSFNRAIYRDDLDDFFDILDKEGLRPVKMEEFLCFGFLYLKEYLDHPVVAIQKKQGLVCPMFSPILFESNQQRGLLTLSGAYSFVEIFYFLLGRK